MIIKYPQQQSEKLLPFFKKHKYLYMLLEGGLKEKVAISYVDNVDNPNVVLVQCKVVIYLSGDSEHPLVPELLSQIPPKRLIFVPSEKWVESLQKYWGKKLHTYPRTKFSSEGLEREHMQDIMKRLPEGLTIERLTEETIEKISDQAKRIISILFPSLEAFLRDSFGFCIKDGEKIASLALAASPIYGKDFEIHIETDPEYQRKGLAMISCAKLIDYSLEKGLIPHWDADNEPSAGLATKLGFTSPEKYFAYYVLEEKE